MTLAHRLSNLGTCSLFEAAGKRGAMDTGLRLLPGASGFAGRAMTVRVPRGDNLALHLLLAEPQQGDVIVVAAGGATDVAIWGDVMTAAAMGRGYRALVVDGAVRDTARVTNPEFSVAARSTTIPGPSKTDAGQIGAPVECGGVTVRQGDWIVADADGVVAIAANEASEVARAAKERETAENAMIQRLRAGQTTTLQELGLTPAPA